MPKVRQKANGEGSIVYEADRKKYRAFITDNLGKRITKRFNSKAEASTWISNMIADISNNSYIPANNITVMEWVLEYLETYKKDKLRPKTLVRYLQTANHLNAIGNIPLQKLTARMVQLFYRELPDMSQSNKIKIHRLLSAAFNKAYVLDMVSKNIMLAVEAPQHHQQEIEIFTKDELTKIKKVLTENEAYKRYYPIFYMALTTGARLGEILGLKANSVHEGYIDINNSLQQLSGTYDERPKTAAGIRKITITAELQSILYNLIALKKVISINGYVFTTKNGTAISPTNFHKAWKKILELAGVKHKHFHSLRHTHATQLLAAGVPILEVSKRLGHSKASHTLNLYGHAIPGYDATLPDKITKIFAI